jgi:1-acyl-sn-glycerol-3-phosphate acyltransferase
MRHILKPFLLIRSLFVTPFFLVYTLICSTVVMLMSFHSKGRGPTDFYIREVWGKPFLKLAGMDLEVRGEENWPANTGVVVLFNHLSWMDIPILMAGLPRTPRFGAKIELFSLPLFGYAMRRVGMLPIERANRNKTLQTYREASARFAQHEVFALAPEGTRQTELTLGKFKQGPFLFAIGSQVPAVPVLIAGVRDVMPKGAALINPWRWKVKIILQILPPVFTAGMTEDQVVQAQQIARERMETAYAKLNAELGLV